MVYVWKLHLMYSKITNKGSQISWIPIRCSLDGCRTTQQMSKADMERSQGLTVSFQFPSPRSVNGIVCQHSRVMNGFGEYCTIYGSPFDDMTIENVFISSNLQPHDPSVFIFSFFLLLSMVVIADL